MSNTDKRILEIWFHCFYMWYVTNNLRHTYKEFLDLVELLQTNLTYDVDVIQSQWKSLMMRDPMPPTDDECLLAMVQESKIFRCTRVMFSPFYKLRGTQRKIRMLAFRKLDIDLKNKINHPTFHKNLLEYVKQICYTFNTNLKLIRKGK